MLGSMRGRGAPRGYWGGPPMRMQAPMHPSHVHFYGIPEDKVSALISTPAGK